MGEDEDRVDGRRQRSERTRLAVIDALLACYDEGIIRPSVADLAARAGVSERSVFRHFDDLEDLADAAIARKLAEVLPLFADPALDSSLDADVADGAALDQRIAALVDQRVRLHDAMAGQARAAAHHAVGSPTIAAAVAGRRDALRAQVERWFAPELATLERRSRRLVVAAVDQALSLEALDHLRDPAGAALGPRDLRFVLASTVVALMASSSIEAPTPRTTLENS